MVDADSVCDYLRSRGPIQRRACSRPDGELGFEDVANIDSTRASFVMKSHRLAAPGEIFPNAIRAYFPYATVPRVMWVHSVDFARLSRISLGALSFDDHVLETMPISDQERGLVLSKGYDALSGLLEADSAEHFNLRRASVV